MALVGSPLGVGKAPNGEKRAVQIVMPINKKQTHRPHPRGSDFRWPVRCDIACDLTGAGCFLVCAACMSLRNYALCALFALAPLHLLPAQNPSTQGRAAAAQGAEAAPTYGGDEGAYFTKAEAYEGAGNTNSAHRRLSRIRQNLSGLSPGAPRPSSASRSSLLASGNDSKAFDAYQTLVARYPDTPGIRKGRGPSR